MELQSLTGVVNPRVEFVPRNLRYSGKIIPVSGRPDSPVSLDIFGYVIWIGASLQEIVYSLVLSLSRKSPAIFWREMGFESCGLVLVCTKGVIWRTRFVSHGDSWCVVWMLVAGSREGSTWAVLTTHSHKLWGYVLCVFESLYEDRDLMYVGDEG